MAESWAERGARLCGCGNADAHTVEREERRALDAERETASRTPVVADRASCGALYCTADAQVGPHTHGDGVLTLTPTPGADPGAAEREVRWWEANGPVAPVVADVDAIARVLAAHQPVLDADGDYLWCENPACGTTASANADHQAEQVAALLRGEPRG